MSSPAEKLHLPGEKMSEQHKEQGESAVSEANKSIENLGLKFRFSEKTYFLRLSGKYVPPKPGSFLVVETDRGVECGEVVTLPVLPKRIIKKDVQILKILRQANADDLTALLKLTEEEGQLSKACIQKIRDYGIPIKLLKTDLVFDRKTVYFYYKFADNDKKRKANFKDITRDLSNTLLARIEFVLVGNRLEAKAGGGYGTCGQGLCCATWLPRPKQVTIKMAKEQNVPINIQKISGACGRLQCCLQYELDSYTNGRLSDIVPKEAVAGKEPAERNR
ncbi:MAG: regulatory iron-sulfur-containing complex subunit RicT [Candidatus Margulisiibacteriota bacterium]|jgi:cell fate regulator YaaT (PSP1 superfamily)